MKPWSVSIQYTKEEVVGGRGRAGMDDRLCYFSQNGIGAVTPAMSKFQLIALKANLLELGLSR